MPKFKTNKSVAKRIRITKNGKIIRNKPGRRHLLSCKDSKTRRNLRKTEITQGHYVKNFKAVVED